MRKAVIAVLLGALLAAGVVAVLVARRPPAMPDAAFEALLASVDSSIAQGYLSTAVDALRSLRDARRSEGDQLRVLKRAFEIGRSSGDYSLLSAMAGSAYADRRGSEPLRAVASWAWLRSGRVADARGLFGRGSAGRLESLRGESLLRSGLPWTGPDGLARKVLSLDASSDPQEMARAGLAADDRRLSLDAALLAMQRGEPAAAAGIARTDLVDPRFDEPAGLVLYDAGAFTEAAARLQRLFSQGAASGSVGLLLSDVWFAGGDRSRAEAWLLRSLPLAPTASWTPYANLALFSLDRSDLPGAARRIDDGLAFFPRSRELRLMKARVRARSGDEEGAQALLTALLDEHPGDTEASLLLLSLQGASISPEALRARLWKLFQLSPTDPAVFDRLAATLMAARDWDGMRIAVEEQQAAGGEPDERSLLMQGFAAAMRGETAPALDAFRRADLLGKDGKGSFDSALVLLQGGGARAAREELEVATSEIEETAPPSERSFLLSRVETLRGAALLLDGDAPGASTALQRARQLDPYNLRAALLLRKLEAGGQ